MLFLIYQLCWITSGNAKNGGTFFFLWRKMGPHDAKPEGLRKLSLTQEAPYELCQNGSQIARTYY